MSTKRKLLKPPAVEPHLRNGEMTPRMVEAVKELDGEAGLPSTRQIR